MMNASQLINLCECTKRLVSNRRATQFTQETLFLLQLNKGKTMTTDQFANMPVSAPSLETATILQLESVMAYALEPSKGNGLTGDEAARVAEWFFHRYAEQQILGDRSR